MTPVDSKTCKQCGADMVRKRFSSGKFEGRQSFEERKYCSTACRHTADKGSKKPRKKEPEPALDETRFAMTFADIGRELGMSRVNAQRIYKQAVAKILQDEKLRDFAGAA